MSAGDAVKAAAVLFVAAIMQVSIFAQAHIFHGVPDLLLVTLVSVALLRGTIVGAAGGFFAGLLVDTATLGQLGLTSLVLTIAGYQLGANLASTDGLELVAAVFGDLGLVATAPGDVLAALGEVVPWTLVAISGVSAALLILAAGNIVSRAPRPLRTRHFA